MKPFAFGQHPLGIEITDTHVKLCELQGRARVKYHETIELPAGAMNDGRIQDESLLLQAFREILNRRAWSGSCVHFAIPSQTVMVRVLKLPNVPDHSLRKIVEFEVKNNIHLPFDDPQYDFVKLHGDPKMEKAVNKKEAAVFQARWEAAAAKEKSSNPFDTFEPEAPAGQEHMCDVLLTAASKEMLQQYIRIFGELGLKLKSMEIKAFSLNRLHRAVWKQLSDGLVVLAEVNGTHCDLTIVRDGFIQLTRNVPVVFTAQEAQPADPLDRMFADFMPQEINYDASFHDLAGEMERLMNFYRYSLNNRDSEFQAIKVSGDIPMLDELIRYLSGRMTMRVSKYSWNGLQVDNAPDEWDINRYSVPLGLCLRGRH